MSGPASSTSMEQILTSSISQQKAGRGRGQTATPSLSISETDSSPAPVRTRRAGGKRTGSQANPPDSASTPEPSFGGRGSFSSLLANLPPRVLAIDFETSGLVARYDQVMEIGCVLMEDGQIIGEPFHSRIRLSMTQKVSLESLGKHYAALDSKEAWKEVGRALKAMYDAPEAKEVLQSFAWWVRLQNAAHTPVVAYNAAFDYGFYSEKFTCFTTIEGGCILGPVWICAMDLVKHVMPGSRRYSLDATLAALSLPPREVGVAHSALQDAILAGRVYFELRRMLEDK